MIVLFIFGVLFLAIAIPLFFAKAKAKRFLTRIFPPPSSAFWQ